MSPTKSALRLARRRRIRSKIRGSAARPRMAVFVSLSRIAVQLIDDDAGKTLASVMSKDKNVAAAKKLGGEIAKKAQDAKISTVVFDRAGRRFHGRLKALADAAREGGLTF